MLGYAKGWKLMHAFLAIEKHFFLLVCDDWLLAVELAYQLERRFILFIYLFI